VWLAPFLEEWFAIWEDDLGPRRTPAGLGPGSTAREEHYGGRITKQGRRELRSTMVEAAWVAVDGHPYWKEMFERLAFRVGKPKAIVAIARKLLVVVWHVLTKQVADRAAVAEQVAANFLEWSWKLGRVNRGGLTSGAFIRRELQRLQMGENITAIPRGNRKFSIRWPRTRRKPSARPIEQAPRSATTPRGGVSVAERGCQGRCAARSLRSRPDG
jgi:hypothetical protein